MSNEIEELRKEMQAMLFKLAAIEAKEENEMWVIPNGQFFIAGDSIVGFQHGYDNYIRYGTTRNTEAELEDLRQKQEFLNISHAFACANDGVQEFVDGNKSWHVYRVNGEIKAGESYRTQELSVASMTEKDAIEFARLCEAGLIPFQYQ